jgi:predicted phosphoribosyltransferase
MVCLEVPSTFYAIGDWYRDFAQVSDREVKDLLALAVHDSTGVRRSPALP